MEKANATRFALCVMAMCSAVPSGAAEPTRIGAARSATEVPAVRGGTFDGEPPDGTGCAEPLGAGAVTGREAYGPSRKERSRFTPYGEGAGPYTHGITYAPTPADDARWHRTGPAYGQGYWLVPTD